ncbi:hypothetical protein [Chryseobacterium sp. SNU WT5]|nr:hypothetical protein [Chryseobacterium sp. SNU WT5]
MKKNYILKKKDLKPRKETIAFLLNYSRNIEMLNFNSKINLVFKN